MPPITGSVYLMGDDVNTDVLHPSRFYSLSSSTRAAGLLSGAGGESMTGRIIIAGRNFGVGSSRESVIRGFIESGVQAVIAKSISRIFYRNAYNAGLPAIICKEAAENFSHAQIIQIDIEQNTLRDESGDITLPFVPIDPYFLGLIKSGGLPAGHGWK